MDVEFTDYALGRMRLRDILEEEVLAVLESPPSRHKVRKDGRYEVNRRINTKVLLVIYKRVDGLQTVINAMWEN